MSEKEINFTLNDVVAILKICHPENDNAFCGSTASLMYQAGRVDMYKMFTHYFFKDISVENKEKICEEINHVVNQRSANQRKTEYVFATTGLNVCER